MNFNFNQKAIIKNKGDQAFRAAAQASRQCLIVILVH